MDNWQSVFKDERQHRIEIVKAVLEDNGMNPVVVDKTISQYGGLGTYEVMVAPDFILQAIKIIKEDIRFG
ncbi:MAG: DUF2007 domain-containing protein [Cyclobacteriaceae bacterium]